MMNNYIVVIPSRGRPDLARQSAALFKYSVVCVADAEKRDYAKVGVPVIPHPDDVIGIGQIRQWVLNNFQEKVVVMADDDVSHVWCVNGLHGYRIEDPEEIFKVLANTANVTTDIDAHVFGFAQGWDVRKFNPTRPFGLMGWTGGVIGFVGRDRRLAFSPNRLRADIDYCLQTMMYHRILFIEQRYSFVHQRFGMTGGNSDNRSAERDKEELKNLLQKWGKYLRVQISEAGTLMVKVNVDRKPKIKFGK